MAAVAPVNLELLAYHSQEQGVWALASAAVSLQQADRVLPVAVREVHVLP